jgi:hypothetical protein
MAGSTSPFLRIPREIRDKIYQCVLLDPAAPIFEGKNKNTKYRNYLGLMYANKLIHGEVKATLEEIKPLFVISCNVEHLGELMTDHALPYISEHLVGQVKCHSVRLHVKFTMGKENTKVLKGYVLLSDHLKETCLLLRCLSLTIPYAPGHPVSTDGTEFPTIQMSVRLESCRGVPMSESTQIQLLEQMTWLNHIGKVTVSGCINGKGKEQFFHIEQANRHAVKAILPGHDERLPTRTQESNDIGENMLHFLVRMNKFRMSRYADGKDAIKVAAWKNIIATRAYRAKDFQLAFDRYLATMEFIGESMDQNVYMLQVERKIEEKLDICSFRAELGLTQSCIGLGNWEEAADIIKIVIKDLPERQYVSKDMMITRARGLEKRIKKKLGAAYDKAPLRKETTAEGAVADLSLNDRKTDASGKENKAGEK